MHAGHSHWHVFGLRLWPDTEQVAGGQTQLHCVLEVSRTLGAVQLVGHAQAHVEPVGTWLPGQQPERQVYWQTPLTMDEPVVHGSSLHTHWHDEDNVWPAGQVLVPQSQVHASPAALST